MYNVHFWIPGMYASIVGRVRRRHPLVWNLAHEMPSRYGGPWLEIAGRGQPRSETGSHGQPWPKNCVPWPTMAKKLRAMASHGRTLRALAGLRFKLEFKFNHIRLLRTCRYVRCCRQSFFLTSRLLFCKL